LAGEGVERMLIQADAVQLPVRSGISASPAVAGSPKIWHAASSDLLKALPETTKLIRAHLE
jgi:hypothetical protein